MAEDHPKKINVGAGILKPGTRPIKVYVDKDGEYWVCDADVDPESADFSKEGCTSYSESPFAK